MSSLCKKPFKSWLIRKTEFYKCTILVLSDTITQQLTCLGVSTAPPFRGAFCQPTPYTSGSLVSPVHVVLFQECSVNGGFCFLVRLLRIVGVYLVFYSLMYLLYGCTCLYSPTGRIFGFQILLIIDKLYTHTQVSLRACFSFHKIQILRNRDSHCLIEYSPIKTLISKVYHFAFYITLMINGSSTLCAVIDSFYQCLFQTTFCRMFPFVS